MKWEQDEDLQDGFVLQAGTDIYDWSVEGRLRQFKERLSQLDPSKGEVIPLIKQAVESFNPAVFSEEVGQVLTVGDEIATVSGLEHAAYG